MDLDSLVQWSAKNALPFNVSKCEKITYSRKTSRDISHVYSLQGQPLHGTDWVRDLGIIMDRGLTYKLHFQQAMQKARRHLGFIIRCSRNFENIQTLLTLYFALVRPHLEFGMLVWCPTPKNRSKAIETVQKRFLKFLYYKTFKYYPVDMLYYSWGFRYTPLRKEEE